ncbi:S8 family peptidase [Burkholderia sp. FERM BP-3421]|uniref:S8 family peptidase n=1 Tax=Burkholderia sp. FERM BP-3421 TaxID=1494466 RepID=UPI003FCE8E0D
MHSLFRTTSYMSIGVALACAMTTSVAHADVGDRPAATSSGAGPVNQLIVKLRPAAQAARGAASATGGAQAGTPQAAGIDAVIDRVLAARRTRAASRAFGAAAAAAPGNAADPAAGVRVKRDMSGGATVLALQRQVTAAEAEALARDFAADGAVEYAEPDVRLRALLTPNDTRYSEQWGYFNPVGGANLPAAWDRTTGSDKIVVAVVDTGYRPHADLAANLLPGYDFVSDTAGANDGGGRDADASDPGDWLTQQEVDDPSGPFYRCNVDQSGNTYPTASWHGTHVAGTTVSNNGAGVAGISWKGKVLPVRVLGKCGGTLSDIVDGMRWAAGLSVPGAPVNRNPARVLNFSLGGRANSCSRSYQSAINEVTAKGSVVVVAAGNENAQAASSQPANCQGVITVGATDSNGRRASFSNYGSIVKISAPGVGILSTLNSGRKGPAEDSYASYNGTSMSTPHVAGTVALMLAANPSLTPAQVLQKLQASARRFPSGSGCTTSTCGAGLLDAGAAVSSAAQ